MSDHLRVILLADAAAYHRERLESHPEKFGADVLARLSAGRAFSATDYARARQARREWRCRLRQAFASVDVILTPTTPLPAPLIDETEGVTAAARLTRFTALFNFAGTPALSVPCGLVSAGLPVGMQIVGRWWEEGMVLGIAHAYEQATEWHTRWPPL